MNEILTLEQFLCSNRHLDYLPWTLNLLYDTENILVASQHDTCNILNEREPTYDVFFNVLSPFKSPSLVKKSHYLV